MYCKKQKILLQVLDRYEKEVIDVVSLWWNEEDARKYAEKKKQEDIEKATAAERASMILGMLHEHLSLDSILRISKGTSEEVLSIAKKNGLVVE